MSLAQHSSARHARREFVVGAVTDVYGRGMLKVKEECMRLLESGIPLHPALVDLPTRGGRTNTVITMSGTIPTNVAGQHFSVPITMWLTELFPIAAPVVYVTPAPGTMLDPFRRHVDDQGKVCCSTLTTWTSTSSLLELCKEMVELFSEDPPLFTEGEDDEDDAEDEEEEESQTATEKLMYDAATWAYSGDANPPRRSLFTIAPLPPVELESYDGVESVGHDLQTPPTVAGAAAAAVGSQSAPTPSKIYATPAFASPAPLTGSPAGVPSAAVMSGDHVILPRTRKTAAPMAADLSRTSSPGSTASGVHSTRQVAARTPPTRVSI